LALVNDTEYFDSCFVDLERLTLARVDAASNAGLLLYYQLYYQLYYCFTTVLLLLYHCLTIALLTLARLDA
jgi:hypothetical protein